MRSDSRTQVRTEVMEKNTMGNLEFGDIVRIKPSAKGKEAETFVIYDTQDDELLALRALPKANQDNNRGIVISDECLVEGKLGRDHVVQPNKIRCLSKDLNTQKIAKINTQKIDELLRQIVSGVVEKHYTLVHERSEDFIPGKSYIRYAGRVYDAEDMKNLVDSSLDFWLTAGRFSRQFEKEFSAFLGVGHCILTNSGSSANLLAVSALTSPKLGERRLKPGDEVITTACAFPTTVNPIIQNGLIPVFVDVEIGTYNVQPDAVDGALSEKTRAVFLAHTLGNPFDLEGIGKICKEADLWLIEDSCDALGSKYNGRYTGTYGDIATFSFYPAHHITMGEGGALVTNTTQLNDLITSFRDWGRDCWCYPGNDNTCGKRFGWQLGSLPFGYDHKYIYSHIGYNLKVTDMQAAVGVSQLQKLPHFIKARKENWMHLYEGLKEYERYFLLPEATHHSDPSWFGFLLTIREDAPFTRNKLVDFLEHNKIATRLLFSGNITRHPSFENVKYRIFGDLKNTDLITTNTLWVGVYPGLTREMIEYVLAKFKDFIGTL